MATPTRPTNIDLPFAVSGTKNTIPDAPSGSHLASYTQGFPPITMLPITSGGIPPEGDDFNGIFFSITKHTLWVNAGGQYLFDGTLSTAIGGYPKGMVLQNNALTASYISLVDNNTTDFNATPASIGVLWGAYSGKSFSSAPISTTGGPTTISAIQALANVITVSGTLASDATLTFPAALAEFTVINNTVGAFSVTCLPLAGSGVKIRQGRADIIVCDGTNMRYQQASAENQAAHDTSLAIANTTQVERAASRVGGYFADTGGAANVYVIATVPPTTSYADGQTVRFKPAHSCTGASTLDAGAGPVDLLKGDGGPLRNGDALTSMVVTATFDLSIGKFIVNGLIVPDISLGRPLGISSTITASSGEYLVDTRAGAFAVNLNASPVLYDCITFRDVFGTFETNNFTLLTGAGPLFTTKLGTTNTLTCNKKGTLFSVIFDGTNWSIF